MQKGPISMYGEIQKRPTIRTDTNVNQSRQRDLHQNRPTSKETYIKRDLYQKRPTSI